jgi:LysM repeat protein
LQKKVSTGLTLAIIFTLILVPVAIAQASFWSFLLPGVQAQVTPSSGVNIQNMSLPNPEYQENLDTDLKKTATMAYSYKNEFFGEGLLVSEIGPLGADSTIDDSYLYDTITVYTVHKGDSLSKIAKLFDVSENTIRWANNLKTTDVPKEGDTLVILPVSGVSYVVKKGDTLVTIAKKFKADAEEIGRFNGYEVDSALAYGETIIIPDGEIVEVKPETKKKTTTSVVAGATKLIKGFGGGNVSGYFMRPLKGGVKTQGLHGKNGVDIAAPVGTPIYASASGTAIVATSVGYNGGYGKYVILSHSNGTQTIYGHMNSVLISRGESVVQGQQIGTVGSTGKSTGPHIHFEIRGAVNPF